MDYFHKGALGYEELCTFLVPPDLMESYCSWPVLLGILYKAYIQEVFLEVFSPMVASLSSVLAPPLLVSMVKLLLPSALAARLGMTIVISLPPSTVLPLVCFSPTPLAREDCSVAGPVVVSAPLSLGLCPGFDPVSLIPPTSGCNLSSSYAEMEKKPIRGLGGLFRRCMLFLFYLV